MPCEPTARSERWPGLRVDARSQAAGLRPHSRAAEAGTRKRIVIGSVETTGSRSARSWTCRKHAVRMMLEADGHRAGESDSHVPRRLARGHHKGRTQGGDGSEGKAEWDGDCRVSQVPLDASVDPTTRADNQAHLRGPLQERGVARNQDRGPGQARRRVRRRSTVGTCARTRQAKFARRDTPLSMQPSTAHQSRSCTAFSGSHRFGNAWLLMIPSSSGSTNR